MGAILPRFSLATAMLAVLLGAADLAAFLNNYRVDRDGCPSPPISPNLVLSLIVMANILTVLAFRMATWRRGRSLAFAVGFLAFGLAASVAHLAVDRLAPGTISAFYAAHTTPFNQFCTTCLPWPIISGGLITGGPNANGRPAWLTYYPALALIFCWPQVVLGLLGGLAARQYDAIRRGSSTNPPSYRLPGDHGKGAGDRV